MEVICQKSQGIAFITFNRPDRHNALNSSMLKELLSHLNSTQENVVVLKGAGEKAFISGADIQEMRSMNEEEWVNYCNLGRTVLSLLEKGPFVSIAAINGYTFGGGLEVALACDIMVASDKAQFGLPEVKLGLIPSFSGITRFTEAVGKYRASAWMLTGATFSAIEAKEMGLVHKVCPPDQLNDITEKLALQIKQNSPAALLGVKNVMQGEEEEEAASIRCFLKEERELRMDAFLNRKKHA